MNLVYLLFPFFGLFTGIKHFFYSNKRAGLLIFAFFFGYTVNFYSGDIIHYRDDFKGFQQITFTDYFQDVTTLNNNPNKDLGVYNSKPDIYAYTIGFLISRITDNPRWFFAVISFLYFFAFFKFFQELRNYINFQNTFGFRLFALAIILIVPFYVGVTGVRFWTALFVFMYFLMRYLNSKKIILLFISAIAILIHYTFLFPVLVAFLAYSLKLNKTVLKLLIIIGTSYALVSSTTNSLQFISDALSILDFEQAEEVSVSYLDQDKLNIRTEVIVQANWYVKARGDILNLFFFTFFILDYFKFIKWKVPIRDRYFENFYNLFFLISVFTLNLGSISRFIYIFYLLVLIRILMIQYSPEKLYLKNINKIFIPILILHVFVTFRAGFYFVDPLLLISPSVFLLFIQSNISLSELLVGH